MEKITFEKICDAEPDIRKLFDLASMIGRRRGKIFCANEIWYEFFKPKLVELVGYDRSDHPLLGTEDAYDVAYDCIYNALPDCKGACMCFPSPQAIRRTEK